jgi:hypothetical protein
MSAETFAYAYLAGAAIVFFGGFLFFKIFDPRAPLDSDFGMAVVVAAIIWPVCLVIGAGFLLLNGLIWAAIRAYWGQSSEHALYDLDTNAMLETKTLYAREARGLNTALVGDNKVWIVLSNSSRPPMEAETEDQDAAQHP